MTKLWWNVPNKRAYTVSRRIHGGKLGLAIGVRDEQVIHVPGLSDCDCDFGAGEAGVPRGLSRLRVKQRCYRSGNPVAALHRCSHMRAAKLQVAAPALGSVRNALGGASGAAFSMRSYSAITCAPSSSNVAAISRLSNTTMAVVSEP